MRTIQDTFDIHLWMENSQFECRQLLNLIERFHVSFLFCLFIERVVRADADTVIYLGTVYFKRLQFTATAISINKYTAERTLDNRIN